MTCHPKPFKVGDVVRAQQPCFGGYPLPDGLEAGATVRVMADLGHSWYRVERDGQVFTLYTVNIDTGRYVRDWGPIARLHHPLVAAVRRSEERWARAARNCQPVKAAPETVAAQCTV